MNIDIDAFYKEWTDLKPRIEAMLTEHDAAKLLPKVQTPVAAAGPVPVFVAAPALPGKDTAKDLFQSGQSLENVGAALGITRVTKASGHGFDEDDASYKRRLLSEIVGAPAADAELARMAAAETGDTKIPAMTSSESSPEALAALHGDEAAPHGAETDVIPRDTGSLRRDGPTIADWVAHGYPAKKYPMPGYAATSTPEEIAAAVAADEAKHPIEQGTSVAHPDTVAAAEQGTSAAHLDTVLNDPNVRVHPDGSVTHLGQTSAEATRAAATAGTTAPPT